MAQQRSKNTSGKQRAMAEQAGAGLEGKSANQAVEAAGIAADRLRSLVERIERLEEEKQALAGDIREVFAEAKGAGFDTKIMRQVIKLRKMESDDRQEQETLLDLYKQALGMLHCGRPAGRRPGAGACHRPQPPPGACGRHMAPWRGRACLAPGARVARGLEAPPCSSPSARCICCCSS
jgi:uncharacterized protein (UPF0335 family)